jgi:BirA family transcriptional regulator, biotin operon repressor / biotin---[acetyl-CoA-carboxylase] ligase
VTDDTPGLWIAALEPIQQRLERELPGRWAGFEFLPTVDSTNRRLLECQELVCDGFRVCVAREQTAGRGRRGRTWLSVGDAGLTFSLGRALKPGEVPTPALALAVGVGLARGLARCGLQGFGFKWPNDLVTLAGAKLAGILVEARSHAAGRLPALVAGVGLNCRDAAELDLDRAVADLAELSAPDMPPLPDLLHAILAELVLAWEAFARDGLLSVLDDYRRLDYLFGQRVRISESGLEGVGAGVDPVDGALLVQGAGGLRRVYSGDVSVRRVGDD